MNPYTQIRNRKPGKFRVGDRVRMLHGFRGTIAEVIEDRGNLGINGRRLYAVKFQVDPWNEFTTEIPEESLEAVTDPPENGKRQSGQSASAGDGQ